MDLKLVLERHAKWLRGEEGGERANLCCANLRGANLRDANLYGASLYHADLSGADLCGANLYRANLYCADLSYANLRYADLSYASLRDADLRGTNLRDANLYGANLYGADLYYADLCDANLSGANLCDTQNADKVIWNICTAFYPLQCPETGAFIGYKKAAGKIIMLEICADAKRSSATSRKCRCSKAKVLSITNLDGSESGLTEVASYYDEGFIYRIGEVVEVPDFDENRWEECAAGIHFFITREEAVNICNEDVGKQIEEENR